MMTRLNKLFFLEFVVNKTGEVSDIKVLNEVHPVLKEEAIRVIKLFTLLDTSTIKR
jgi:hypothetical protein